MNAPPLSLEELWQRHAEMMRVRHFAERTIHVGAGYFRTFLSFLAEQKITDASVVTESLIRDYQRHLFYLPTYKGTARAPGTLKRALVVVKGFFHFLKSEGYIARDPAEAVEYGRQPRHLPRNVLTPKEAKRIIEACDTSTLNGYRNRTVLEVLYATGIRINELLNLTLEDVRLEEQLLFIRSGKGNQDRVVPLGRQACKCLETYIKGIRCELLRGRASDRLFISLRGRPISSGTLRWVFTKHAKLARVPKHVTAHLWRHTCATHLVQNRANLRHVQEMLGHRSLSTTERYLSLTIQDLKDAHRKYHPREKETRP